MMLVRWRSLIRLLDVLRDPLGAEPRVVVVGVLGAEAEDYFVVATIAELNAVIGVFTGEG